MTFADFVTAIQNEINDIDAAMKTRIEGWTNDIHHFVCSSKRWQWLILTTASFNIKSSTNPFSLAKGATFTYTPRAVLDVVDMSFDPNKPLIPTSEDVIRTSYSQYVSPTGVPYWWYVQADAKLGLWPLPDTTGRNYTVRYLAQPDTLSTGSTTALLVPERWIEVIKDGVLGKAYNWLDKDKKAQLHEAKFVTGLERMKAQDGENQLVIYRGEPAIVDIFPETIVYP